MLKAQRSKSEIQGRIIGLTGPIGAGKDAVGRILQRRGAFIINADRLAHQLYAPQSPLWHELVRTFGSKILMRGGRINRKKLGAIVFSDKKELNKLNALVHPRLRDEIRKIIESRKQSAEHRTQTIVVNAAVLKEIGLIPLVDEVWLVTAPKDIRLKRLIKSGLTAPAAARRMKAQVSPKEYLKMADIVIKNDGTLRQLSGKIQACLKF
ncbi:MAG: dephospho-CoA kinase [Candidatus Margulisbacteria bacterium]|nr:dephospho-CoA kinase [Candidatus Margulisiibacteriota bacterium]